MGFKKIQKMMKKGKNDIKKQKNEYSNINADKD